MNRSGRFLLVLLPLVVSWNSGVDAEDSQEILDRALIALGGESELEALRSLHATGSFTVSGISGTLEWWAEAPNKLCQVFDLNVITIERAYDGSEGWTRRGDALTPMVGDDLDGMKRTALFQPLLTYKRQGVPMEFLGRQTIEGGEVFVLQISPASAPRETYYFDTESHLLVKDTRVVSDDEGDYELAEAYSDYREVGKLRLPFSITRTSIRQTQVTKVASYELNAPIAQERFENPSRAFEGEPYQITVRNLPLRPCKENDGVWGDGATESWSFYVVVDEQHSRPVDTKSAVIELRSKDTVVKTITLSSQALEVLCQQSFGSFSGVREVLDLSHSFTESVALDVDHMVYRLTLTTPDGQESERVLDIPVIRYKQKTRLIMPLKGKFMVVAGHHLNEDHRQELSQHFAYDIVGLSDDYGLVKNEGAANEDFFCWGREILAPAAGTIVYVRDDIPDNVRPGIIETASLIKIADPMNAIAGNNIIIDHGNGEYSLLGHLQFGSIRVKTGDHVEQGETLGRLGNSGNSDGPHLHYHLMAGPIVFQSDPLPARFDDLELELLQVEATDISIPKRGVYLDAK